MDEDYKKIMGRILELIGSDDRASEISAELEAIGLFTKDGQNNDTSKLLYKEAFQAVMKTVADEKGWTDQFRVQAAQQLLLSVFNIVNSIAYTSEQVDGSKNDYYNRQREKYLKRQSQKRIFRKRPRSRDRGQDYELDL